MSGTAADPGIVPIAVNELFHMTQERRGFDTFQITLGYMEVHICLFLRAGGGDSGRGVGRGVSQG